MSPRSSPEQTVFSRAHAILLGFSYLKTSFSLVASTKDDANKEMCYEQARQAENFRVLWYQTKGSF